MQHRAVGNAAPAVHTVTGLAVLVCERMVVRLRVAIAARTVHLAMVHGKHIPPITARRMAGTAQIGCVGVTGRLIIEVTVFATAKDLIMVYGKHLVPLGTGAMASSACVGSGRMILWFIRAVAGFACANDLGVIHTNHRIPRRVIMARFTNIGRSDMGRGFARCRGAVVAVNTSLPRDRGVIEL